MHWGWLNLCRTIQHLAGMSTSKYIVAINKDIRAPIVRISDAVIIDDYKAVMDELAKIMRAQPKGRL